jgi:O-antigen/teichoic acid export membrane protein
VEGQAEFGKSLARGALIPVSHATSLIDARPASFLGRKSLSAAAAGASSTGWAISDQAVVSLGNFLTTIILARNLYDRDFGIYAVIFGLLLLLNSCHAALIVLPLSVKGVGLDLRSLGTLSSSCLLLSAGLAVIFLPVLGLACWLTGKTVLVLSVGAALICGQQQETTRRTLIAHLRHRAAFLGDAVSYLGQAALVWQLTRIGHLTLSAAFWAMAVTSVAALLIQGVQVHLRRLDRPLLPLVKDFWKMGHWMLWTYIAGLFSWQLFPWCLAIFHGPAAAAAFQAVANCLGVTHPLVLGVGGLILPAAARSYQESGLSAAAMVTRRFALQGFLLLSPYMAILLLFPRSALRLFYGVHPSYIGLETSLRMFVLAYAFFYGSIALSGFLNGVNQTWLPFRTQVLASIAALVIGLPLIAYGGVLGAVVGFMAANGSRAFANLNYARRLSTPSAISMPAAI